MKKIFFSFFILSSLNLATCGPAKNGLEKMVEKITLSNGLTCLFVKREGAPVFSATIRIKVGAIEDPKGYSGMAHFFEHMAFKGTRLIGDVEQNEFVRIYQRNGGTDLNATTSSDFTEYFVSLPAGKLEMWAYMESQRLTNPVFREFYKERDVVIEERRMRYENSPDGRLYEKFMESSFGRDHPYGRSVIGYPEEISKYNYSEATRFHDENYIPSRIVMALVGNFDIKEAKKYVKKYFGALSPPPATTASAGRPSPWFDKLTTGSPLKGGGISLPSPLRGEGQGEGEEQTLPRQVTIKGKDEPRFYTGFHRPAYPHPDDVALDVLQVLLCEGRTSRLFSSLVKDKQLAAGVDCYASLPGNRLDGVFAIYAIPMQKASNRRVLNEITNELNKIKTDLVSAQELEKIKNKIDADLIWALEKNMGMASWLTYFESLTGNWKYFYEFQHKVKIITAEDLRLVAQTYFVPEKQVTVFLEKK